MRFRHEEAEASVTESAARARAVWPFLFSLLVAFAPFQALKAAVVDAGTAETAVSGWLSTDPLPLGTSLGRQVLRVETFRDADAQPLYHVVYLSPLGFVIVSADDLVEPIIAFVPEGAYDPDDSNPLGALVSSDVPGRVAAVRDARAMVALAPAQETVNKWDLLIRLGSGSAAVELGLSSISDVRIDPLTKSRWSQSYVGTTGCYNYYTPPFAEGTKTNYPCGCVATAMAQLMRFWQYPVNGVGTPSFTISTNSVSYSESLLGGNGSGGPYDWANMSLTNFSSSTTIAQRRAIGALCHDAGVSVNMSYTEGSSGANTSNAKNAFVNTFGYANAIKGYKNGNTIGAGLDGMVNPNLDAGCPVLLGITGSSGGHAIVCDGYGYNVSTLYHHLNMGWSGTSDAWYNLPTIDAIYSFTNVYRCVYNVWTNGTGEIISGRVTGSSGLPLQGVTVTAVRSVGGTYTATTDSRGIYALARVPSASSYTVSAVKEGYTFTSQSVSTGTSADYGSTAGNRWGIDFSFNDAAAPVSLTATASGPSLIALDWQKNASGDDVLVAWSTNATFGTPSGTYAVGSAIAGGGHVLYVGSATNVTHEGLSGNSTRYYAAWSVSGGSAYSSSLTASATTENTAIFSEDFENGGLIPIGWTQTQVTSTASWNFQSGGHNGYPSVARGGSYNAFLYYESSAEHKTILSTPPIDFGHALENARLTFWHCMQLWSPDLDELRVYYKTSAGGSWILLAEYTDEVGDWTQQTVVLPNPCSTYYIGFEGNAQYGYGVCIDDVEVVAGFTADSFDAWAQTHCPGVAAVNVFTADRDEDGVANGFEYAFGTNWTAGALLLDMALSAGSPVVDIPRQISETATYVDIYLEMTRSLSPASWSSNGIESVTDPAEPGNRSWFRPVQQGSNAFFRLKGALK